MGKENIKWDIRQRMKLIEATLIWSGRLGRKDLITIFQISEIQAAKDLTHYQKMCPGNIVYDRTLKRYVPQKKFKPYFLRGTGVEFLHLLKSATVDIKSPTLVLLSNLPPTEILEPPERKLPGKYLQKINFAIHNKQQLSVIYQSMNRNNPSKLILSPHAIIHNGFRWHIRAYSKTHDEFRDFLLARIRGTPEIVGVAKVTASEDHSWNRLVTIKIGPHPGLSKNQRDVIEDDYGMKKGMLKKRLRAALVPYFVQLMRVGKDDEVQSAEIQQIILLNKKETEAYLF